MRLYFGTKVLLFVGIVFGGPAFSQEQDCLTDLIEKANDRELVQSLDILTCVQSVLSQNAQRTEEIARAESSEFFENLRPEFEQIARRNFVYLGRINSCEPTVISVPDIDGTTTDDWHVLTSSERYTAQFGTGEMRNNALYSVSFVFEPSADKQSWNGFLAMQVNAATEQKREATDYCRAGGNRDGSSAELYAVRKYAP